MLRDEIGGNTKTRVLTCVKPSSDPEEMSAILKFASHLSQVKNYPILNDSFAQVTTIIWKYLHNIDL